MRSFGETGFDGSWANASSAVRARTVVAPASARNWRRVGWRNGDMDPPGPDEPRPRPRRPSMSRALSFDTPDGPP